MAMGHALDTASAWSPARTATCRRRAHILRGGTAYITDIGMCGDYDSVPGWSRPRATRLCAVYLETDEATGVAREVAPLRIGGRLAPQWST